MISRQEFTELCTQAIKLTRKKIAIRNQKSGYLKHHHAIKLGDPLRYFRLIKDRYYKIYGYTLYSEYKFTNKTRIGNCGEISWYLAYKIAKALKKMNVDASIRLVSSRKVDHSYLRIRLTLDNEKSSSLWEVDAWHPRIIDISVRPDGTMKNKQALQYGTYPKLIHFFSTLHFKKEYNPKLFSILDALQRPKKGKAPDATPEHKIFARNASLYNDYTIKEAFKKKLLVDEGAPLHMLQKASTWQCKL